MNWTRVVLGSLMLLPLFLGGCASYSQKISKARHFFITHQYNEAVEALKPLAEKKDNDYLLYLLELGIAYHAAGRYEEAVKVFLEADKQVEIKDYTSLAQEAGQFVFSEQIKPYKGEHFENILINVYLAMDYTLMGKWEDALVECRRVNHKLDKMISEGKLPYEHNAFAKYLSASLFESRHEFNDAFVDYRQMAKWQSGYPYLPVALLRMADKLKALQELQELKEKYPNEKDYRIGRGEGEVILFLEQGKAPYKIPHPNFYLVPLFARSSYSSDYVWIHTADGKYRARTYPLFDIETTAINELQHRSGAIIAKKIAGIAVKEAAGYGVEKATGSKFLGALTALTLRATDQADLRSWTLLPARLHLARLTLPAGRHDLVVDMVGYGGVEGKGIQSFPGVEVKPGAITFLSARTPD